MTIAVDPSRTPGTGKPTRGQRSRGRPSKREAEAIDRNILEAAKLSFLADGFGSTTMDFIAKRAGVTKATLYQRYDDKAALLRAVMEDRIEAWTAVSNARVVSRGETLEERLLHYARSMTRWSVDPEVRAFGNLVRECWGSARHVAEEMHMLRTMRMRQVLEMDIRAFAASEGIHAASPKLLADLFMAMVAVLHQRWDEDDQEWTVKMRDQSLEKVVSMLLMGSKVW